MCCRRQRDTSDQLYHPPLTIYRNDNCPFRNNDDFFDDCPMMSSQGNSCPMMGWQTGGCMNNRCCPRRCRRNPCWPCR